VNSENDYTRIEVLQCGCSHFSIAAVRVEKKVWGKKFGDSIERAHLDTTTTRFAKSLTPRVMSDSGERTRPRVRGSAPSLNPLPDVSDAGIADHTRGRVCSPKHCQWWLYQDAPALSIAGPTAADYFQKLRSSKDFGIFAAHSGPCVPVSLFLEANFAYCSPKEGGTGPAGSLLCLHGISGYDRQCGWEAGLGSQPEIRVH